MAVAQQLLVLVVLVMAAHTEGKIALRKLSEFMLLLGNICIHLS